MGRVANSPMILIGEVQEFTWNASFLQDVEEKDSL